MIPGILIILATVTLLLFALSKSKSTNSSKLPRPPGPWSLPILGHLHLLGDQPARKLLEWKKTYGPIISVTFGSFPAVVINDASLIKAAFSLPSFSGRPHIKLIDDTTLGRKVDGSVVHGSGLLGSQSLNSRRVYLKNYYMAVDGNVIQYPGFMFRDGPAFTEQRQFIKRYLKDFGYGTLTMESVVIDQVLHLLKKFDGEASKSQPFQVKHFFSTYAVNALWSIVSGKQLDPENAKIVDLTHRVARAAEFSGILSKLMVFIPRIAVWFPSFSGYNERMQTVKDVHVFLEKQIQESKLTRIRNQPRVVMDAYLDKVEDTTDPQSCFHERHGNITVAMQDLFNAGVETSSTTMEWVFYYLAKYPEVQTKLQIEIDAVIGSSRLPSGSDKLQMPYTEAVINEVLRIPTIVPLSLYHSVLEDVEFHGYHIPKDTVIFANLHAAHNDPQVWDDPEEFRPDRFLDKDGAVLKIKEFIPFSWGKRSCIGEHLARLQLFLVVVCLYQRFEITAAGVLPSPEGSFGITTAPHPFHVLIKSRTFA